MHWLRRSFVTGFFVTVPLAVSVVAFVWMFRVVDGFVGPIYRRWIGFDIPGVGILTTAALVLVVGVLASNMFGKRVLQRAEHYLLKVPVFSTIYSPVKQIAAAFSPDNEYGFKRVVLIAVQGRGHVLGFLTRELVLDRGRGPEQVLSVYVPTNHLYLGDLVIVPKEAATFPDLTVEEGVRAILTGGMALPSRLRAREGDSRPGELTV